ncbi:MAG: SCP2 sterol-binding domain-containing protein [Bauldia sp.]|nr:SCP2 sterol-binding domain-containing protein [Bauldia sp.]
MQTAAITKTDESRSVDRKAPDRDARNAASVPRLAGLLLEAMPLGPIQMVLRRIASRASRSQPEFFERLGEHSGKRVLIDPTDLPLFLLLVADSRCTILVAHRRARVPPHDVRIRATFGTLLGLLEGVLDGDAAFFRRDVLVEGEVEAAVSLRNALDAYRGDVVEDALGTFGLLHGLASLVLRPWRADRTGRDHD